MCYNYGIESDQLNPIFMTFKNMVDGRRNRGRPDTQPSQMNPPVGGENVPWPQFMQQMQQQQNQFMLQMMQHLNGGPPAPVVVPEAAGGTYRDFFRMNPPEFHGGLDPIKAHEWVASMGESLR